MDSNASISIVLSLLWVAMVQISFAAILTVKPAHSSEPIIADSAYMPLLRRSLVNESHCGNGVLHSRLHENMPCDRSSRSSLWILPQTNVDLGDADDPMAHPDERADSLTIRTAPHRWSICAHLSRRSEDVAFPVYCKPLLSPAGFIFIAGCCSGFGESPRGQDLFMHVWLQDEATSADLVADSQHQSSVNRDHNHSARRAVHTVSLAMLPPSGSSVDLTAATAVEVHLPPLPPLTTHSSNLHLSSSNATYFPEPTHSKLHENVKSNQTTSSAIVPPFVIWRNASFATLERLARTAAVAARRAETVSRDSDIDTHGAARQVVVDDDTPSDRSSIEYRIEDDIAKVDASGADTTTILDQMLVHLARPLLCIKAAEPTQNLTRPARILVLGDSHTYIFTGAASHYHETTPMNFGGESVGEESACALSNYRTCWAPSASAHGLGNPKSKTGSAVVFEACVEESQSSPETTPDIVAVMIGEVDMRWVAAARQASKGITTTEQIQTSADRLIDFVERVLIGKRGLQWQQVVLLGASAICPRGPSEVVRHELFYNGQEFDPNHAILRFNTLLSNICRDKGCRFADPTDDLFDYPKGQVHSFFHSDPAEMHCNIRPFFFWHRALLNVLPDRLEWCHSS